MLDTVVLRFHDITGAHARLAQWLDKPHTGTGKTMYVQPLDADRPNITASVAFLKLTKYHDTGNVQRIAHFNHLTSAHYEIAYRIDDSRDFIEFNLSIPKYIFGTNIIHYNTPPMGRDFSTSRHSRLKTNLRESYDRLYHFINKFISNELGGIEVDARFVEINRVDICFNQMFDCKETALEYLAQLKKLRKKNARSGSNYSRDWKTTITYQTDRWSFKVYHKGEEFAKHDAKKLRDLNESGKLKYIFDVPFYQRFADNILRYEMTIRNSHMSYLYMQHLFRADCHIWNAGVELVKTQKLKKADFQAYAEFKAGLEGDEPKLLAYVASIINKTKKFYLAPTDESDRYDQETDQGRFYDWPGRKETFNAAALFSRELWDLLTGEFLRELGNWKLEIHADANNVIAKAEAINAKIIAKREVVLLLGFDSKSKQYKEAGETILISKLTTLMELLKTYTFEQLEDSKLFSRTTWYRYRKLLKELGVTQNSLLSVPLLSSHDLKSYNSELLHNSYKFVNLSF